jgi:hypothetical protein
MQMLDANNVLHPAIQKKRPAAPRARKDILEKRKISCFSRGSNSGFIQHRDHPTNLNLVSSVSYIVNIPRGT